MKRIRREMSVAVKRAMLAGPIYFFIAVAFALSFASEYSGFIEWVSLIYIATVAVVIIFHLIRKDGSFGVTMADPMPLYGLFYLLYYVIPYLALFFSHQFPEGNELIIASLLLVGYCAWLMGTQILRKQKSRIDMGWVSRSEAQALLAVCILGIMLIVLFYWGRLEEGIFYNQAQFVSQKLTVADSIVSGLGQQIQLPIILLLGLLSAVKHGDIARLSRRILVTYGLGISVILILSSQTRAAITAMLFLFMATRIYQEEVVRLRHIALVIGFSSLAIVVIQGLRIQGTFEFANAQNQLSYSVVNALPDALSAISNHRAELVGRVISRGGGGISFLAETIRAIDDRGGPFYGKGILFSADSLIPRFLWLDKPVVAAPQLVAQELLQFPILYDAALGPTTQFYFEGGWIGVVFGYLLFGLGMSWLTNCAIKGRSVYLWIMLSFIWGHIANIELELVLGVLGAIRSAVIVWLLWRFLTFIVGDARHIVVRQRL